MTLGIEIGIYKRGENQTKIPKPGIFRLDCFQTLDLYAFVFRVGTSREFV